MGDRVNIVVEDAYTPGKVNRVYLYSHWGGETVIESAIVGLKSDRTQDHSYLARIIFNDMTKDDAQSETGYGISATITDNEHPVMVISVGIAGTRVYFEENKFGGDFTACTPKITVEQFFKALDLIKSDGDSVKELANQSELYAILMEKMDEVSHAMA